MKARPSPLAADRAFALASACPSKLSWLCLCCLCSVALLLGACSAPEATTEVASEPSVEASAEASRIVLRVDPLADLYFRTRAQAAGRVEPIALLSPAVEAWMPVQQEVGSFGGFWRFDLAGLLAEDPSEFTLWFSDFPETIKSRRGGDIPIKGAGVAMGAAFASIWPTYLESEWPAREAQVESLRAQLERGFMANHQRALAHMMESLGIDDPKLEVPLTLVPDTQPPGATTYRTQTGPVVVLSTAELLSNDQLSELEETILHETAHVLDLASDGETDAFTVLRRLLQERGVAERDPRLHDIPHLVMFAQAENTMRRLFDPDHVAYGDTWRGDIAPLYERSGRAAVVVRERWASYLDGDVDRQKALQQIVNDLVTDTAD